jgi:hypothetical protein
MTKKWSGPKFRAAATKFLLSPKTENQFIFPKKMFAKWDELRPAFAE